MHNSLNRFISAQSEVYRGVLSELGNGRKRSHWMWYIFPQIDGLGFSATARLYAIKSLDEAREYLNHPVLGSRLIECTRAVLEVNDRDLHQIFGSPDDLKFCSSMTLFEYVSTGQPEFSDALERYCNGKRDIRTLELLASGKL